MRNPRGGLDVPLALLVAALVFYVLANVYPLLTLEINGISRASTLSGAAFALYQSEMMILALLVFLTSVVAPGLLMLSTVYVLAALRYGKQLPKVREILSVISHLQSWEMADVFIVGVLVALVKLSGQAYTLVGLGLYALIASIALAAAARINIDIYGLWRSLEERN